MVTLVLWLVLVGTALVVGHGVFFWLLYRWGGLPPQVAVRLGVVLGTLLGFVLACWLVPGGGGMLSFLNGGPLTPGAYYCGAAVLVVVASFVPPGWSASH